MAARRSSSGSGSNLAHLVGFDNEAGRLLASIYGKSGKAVNVPVPRTKEWAPAEPFRRPMMDSAAADPRDGTFDRDAAAEFDRPPELPVEHKAPAMITQFDARGLRKPASKIEAEKQASLAAGADRPQIPIRPGRNNEKETRRLQTQFQFKGGKALPECALPEPIKGAIPLSVMTGKPSSNHHAYSADGASAARRRGDGSDAVNSAEVLLEELEMTRQHVEAEVQDRTEFLQEIRSLMASTGVAFTAASIQEKEVSVEIQSRIAELGRLDTKINEQKKKIAELRSRAAASSAAAAAYGAEY